MHERDLNSLRRALTAPLGAHVDDETLALLVTTEAAGEDIEETYATPLAHIERCAACAESYFELAQMMLAAVAEMDAAADAIAPEDIYASLLAQELEREGLETWQARQLAEAAAHALPLGLTAVPAPEDVDQSLMQAVLGTVADTGQSLTDLVRAVQRTASSLDLYLRNLADAVWERQVVAKKEIEEGWARLQITLAHEGSAKVIRESGPEWMMFREQVNESWPLAVEARAERIDAISCRLVLQLKQSQQPYTIGGTVRLRVGSKMWEAVADHEGTVQFAPLPIAALPALLIEVDIT